MVNYREYKECRLNQKNLAAAIGVTPMSVNRYVQQGMPYHGEKRNKYFLLDEVMEWMKDQPKLFERYVEIKIKIENAKH